MGLIWYFTFTHKLYWVEEYLFDEWILTSLFDSVEICFFAIIFSSHRSMLLLPWATITAIWFFAYFENACRRLKFWMIQRKILAFDKDFSIEFYRVRWRISYGSFLFSLLYHKFFKLFIKNLLVVFTIRFLSWLLSDLCLCLLSMTVLATLCIYPGQFVLRS